LFSFDFSRFPGVRMQNIQSSARSSASAVFPSSSASSLSSSAAATVGHNPPALTGRAPQLLTPPTFRGMVPSSVGQQNPYASVHTCTLY